MKSLVLKITLNSGEITNNINDAEYDDLLKFCRKYLNINMHINNNKNININMQSIDIYIDIKSYVIFFRQLIESICSANKDSANDETQRVISSLRAICHELIQISYLEKRKSPEIPQSSPDFIIVFILVPCECDYFRAMAIEVKEDIALYNKNEVKFITLKYGKRLNETRSTMDNWRQLDDRNSAVQFYILGHENKGKVGCWIEQTLGIQPLLEYLYEFAKNFTFQCLAVLTFCNGHNPIYTNQSDENLLVEVVTSDKFPLAGYFSRNNKVFNISFNFYNLKKCIRSMYDL